METFLIAPSERARLSLRRYQRNDEPCPHGYHNASAPIGFVPMTIGGEENYEFDSPEKPAKDDPRWPVKCEHCTYHFAPDDCWQLSIQPLYVAADGRETSLHDAPTGAMWDAFWLPDNYKINGSGPCWIVRLPNGDDWTMGSNATNCPREGEDHDCWCVHGEAPKLTVDKNPEPGRTTCNAGGGSIWAGQGTERDWHGFLRDGQLVQA